MRRVYGLRASVFFTEGDNPRGFWRSKTESILSALGYAIGIGNIWRFPYLCYRNGGGAFLIPYTLTMFFCGIPLYYMEANIGQFSNTGCITMFRMSPFFRGAGYAMIIMNTLCNAYYGMILTYPLIFIAHSMKKELSWSSCNHFWNTPDCVDINDPNIDIPGLIKNNTNVTIAVDEYFHHEVLKISDSIGELGEIVCPIILANIVSWFIIYICVSKGVNSVGKASYFTCTFPMFVLIVLLCRGVTLPGAIEGIKFFIYPDWNRLKNLKVWSDASVQTFFMLGPGWGGIVNMASYNKFSHNNLIETLVLSTLNFAAGIFAGFAVFSVIGFMSERTGVSVEEVIEAGPALVFITYPAAITLLPLKHLWGILFFLMLFFIGIDTVVSTNKLNYTDYFTYKNHTWKGQVKLANREQRSNYSHIENEAKGLSPQVPTFFGRQFVQLETIVSAVCDAYPDHLTNKSKTALYACLITFFVGVILTTNGGMYCIQLMDSYAANVPVIVICFIEVLIVGWIYGTKKFVIDIEFMRGQKIHWIWPFCWKYMIPTVLIFLFIATIVWNEELKYKGELYPKWTIILVKAHDGLSVVSSTPGNPMRALRLKNAIKPAENWGPSNPRIFLEWRKVVGSEFRSSLEDNSTITENIPGKSTSHSISENSELDVKATKNEKKITFYESVLSKSNTPPSQLFKSDILTTSGESIQNITKPNVK
ncbi:sodium- and chloride-dependent glycine transporter 1-like [Arctopsyche grandis]|uniref:sodium- and chloride-dependent glycine transporter 1-like n=1 Tax=Arctopsyche grandis TaxID=121162 RepID=UPI00406D7B44